VVSSVLILRGLIREVRGLIREVRGVRLAYEAIIELRPQMS
jgi:hypothetical protein